MPAQVDDFNYDIWLEHSSAKVGYRLARDEDGNVLINTGSAPFTAQQIFQDGFSLESINANVDLPLTWENWAMGAGMFELDQTEPNGSLGYYYSQRIDASWDNRLYVSPQLQTGATTVQAPIKFVNSTLGLFVMTARYVREWTGAAWTERLDTGGVNTNTDLIEFSNVTGTYLVLGVSGGAYYFSADGITWNVVGGTPSASLAFRASNQASGTGTSAVVTKPAGTIDDDIMIAIVTHREQNNITAPAGWSNLANQSASAPVAHFTGVYWKRASSEGADYTFTWAASSLYRAVIASFSGAITTGSPFDDNNATSNSIATTSPAIPALTSSGTNRLAVAAFSAVDGADSSTSYTAPSGYTEVFDAAGVVGTEFATLAVAAAGTVGATTATSSVSAIGLGWHGLLIPAGSGSSGATVLDIARFAIRGQANGSPLLWAITSTGDIRNTADPTDGSAWSAADTISMGVGSVIAGLEVVDNVFYLFHSKGITSYDGTAVNTVWNNISLNLSSNTRPYTWVDKGIYFAMSGGLFRYNADSLSIEKMWPRGPQVGNLKVNGEITYITGSETHIYFGLYTKDGDAYTVKCDPYLSATYKTAQLMPVHTWTWETGLASNAALVVPASSNTFSTTNPQLVVGSSTNGRYYILSRAGLRPEDDSNYRFTTDAGNLAGAWTSGGAKTFKKYLNIVKVLTENLSGVNRYAQIRYNTEGAVSNTDIAGTISTSGLSTTGMTSDVEYTRVQYDIYMVAQAADSPRVLGVTFSSSLNPTRARQWEMFIEIANDSELLGGGDSRYGNRYLDTHLFNGLTKRVTLYDRLGNSFITKLLEITSQVQGEDKDVYKATFVQLV